MLEKRKEEPLILLSGLIHREYAVILLLSVMSVKVTEDGRAVVMDEEGEVDVTREVLNMLPQLTSACALSIKNLSIHEDYIDDIKEILNIIALSMYLSVALRDSGVLEKVLMMVAYAISNARSDRVRGIIKERTIKELKELGFDELVEAFQKIAG